MKNIHVLPTDKPSRLYSWEDNLVLGRLATTSINRNIYITSDEEIKEGDYACASGGFRFVKTLNNDKFRTFKDDGIVSKQNPSSSCHLSNYKKIILTTDQDLIKDGVQAIDDEFLEWFIKNPSCEEVEVENIIEGVRKQKDIYKIIIPSEEICSFCDGTGQVVSSTTISRFKTCDCKILPKEELSTKLHIGEVVDESYPKEFKQETLEEVAERLKGKELFKESNDRARKILSEIKSLPIQERSYSEEEVSKAYDEAYYKGYIIGQKDAELHPLALSIANNIHKDKEKWFEQFKKK